MELLSKAKISAKNSSGAAILVTSLAISALAESITVPQLLLPEFTAFRHCPAFAALT